jgi:hypothetical protein
MGDMTKIVTEHVRASELPGYGFAAGLYAQHNLDPTDFVRQLRDEWGS